MDIKRTTKGKRDILKFQLTSTIFYGIHYFLMGGIAAALVTVVSIIRILVIYILEKKDKVVSVFVLIGLIILSISTVFLSYDGPISLIPVGLAVLYTYATWKKDTKDMRALFFIAAWIWIYYNYSIGAYVMVAGNVVEIISGIIAFFRFGMVDKKGRLENKNDTKNT